MRFVRTGLLILVVVTIVAAAGYDEARQDPIVRTALVRTDKLQRPFRILFISDVHVQGPDMPPERLMRIMRGLDRLHPDLVLLGGDFLGNKPLGSDVPPRAAIAPFRRLHPAFGTIAVLGNHDALAEPAIGGALRQAGIVLLRDGVRTAGPVSIGGIWVRPRRTMKRLLQSPGPHIVLSHRPDFIDKAPHGIDLFLAGHTHCGQIVFPFIGPVMTGTSLNRGDICGATAHFGTRLIVSAGLGTSHVPIRLGAPPDVWLVTFAPLQSTPSRDMIKAATNGGGDDVESDRG